LAAHPASSTGSEGAAPEATGEDCGTQAGEWSPEAAAPAPEAAPAPASAEPSPEASPEASPAPRARVEDPTLAVVKAVLAKGALDEGTQTSPGSQGGGGLIKAWREEAAPPAQEQEQQQQQQQAEAEQQVQEQQQQQREQHQQHQLLQPGAFSPFVLHEFKPRADAPAPEPPAAEAAAEAAAAEPGIPVVASPKLLARFRVNKADSMAVFMATTAEDFRDVVGLLPANSALPASDRMSYLLGRLEVGTGGGGGKSALAGAAAPVGARCVGDCMCLLVAPLIALLQLCRQSS
jgi:hypothetical protein